MTIIINEIIRSARKSITLTITSDGRLVVKAPLGTSDSLIKQLVEQKKTWIEEKKLLMQTRRAKYKVKQFIDGGEFLYLGKSYLLNFSWQASKVGLDGKYLNVPEAVRDQAKKYIIGWYKEEAKKVLNERVKFFALQEGIAYQKVKITSASRRWGSCSSKGNLNFTWKLVMTPLDIIDYVVVHELCHLEFLNHSREFWAKVERIMPDYKLKQKWLADNQPILEIL
ncbi:MAG: M48 family metallopeptidase [Zhaonellaceae bacterium]|nr:M48 family metallopeptidase [Clostridia bacterium]